MPEEYRAMPAAVFVPENTMRKIAEQIAGLPEDHRRYFKVVFVRSGRYKANTDQIVPYNHYSNLPRPYPKANLVKLEIELVSNITKETREIMEAPLGNEDFLSFIRDSWDESLELNSPVTLLICDNLRGTLVNHYASAIKFRRSLVGSVKE